jgi:lipopolysaccharide export system permease protein
VTNFLLLMIWFWKWLEDIVGKGIEVGVIAELVGYASLNQVPLSLPLAILLSSIMTYGKLGETVELTAIKSLGISLWRAMFPLILLVTLFSGLAFIFSNNVLPQTNKNLKMLLNDVSRQKPELNIPEGVFYNQLEGYSIRIGKKHPDKTLEDIIIFQNKLDNNRFITAHTGRMELGNDGSLLVLTLYDGNAYDQESEKDKINQDKSYPLVHNQFKENQIIFDSMGYQMLKRSRQLYTDLHRNFYFIEDSTLRYDTITPFPLKEKIVLHNFDTVKRKQITHHAADVARNAKNYIHSSSMVLHNQKKIQNRHKVEFHRKFTLSFACILLFFVGAPFGAIVKKGGLGAPVIISVFLFLTFHVLSIVGEKLAKNDTWEAYEGMWMATIVLLPIGILLTYKATSDSAIFNAVAYKKFFLKLIGKGKS